eukprot:GHVU01190804.1.p1 GENE.GHVU01190804.1~~GHVU01190804.1.p1  ORF type:complete len:434 (+),score=50.46 GHVU01190804.1:139-1440(+)
MNTFAAFEFIFNDEDEPRLRRDAFRAALFASMRVRISQEWYRNSPVPRGPNLRRDLAAAESRLRRQYLADDPVYPEHLFRQRFRMSRQRFRSILADLQEGGHLVQGYNRGVLQGASPELQLTVALRILAYDLPFDAMDEMFDISKSSAHVYLIRVMMGLVRVYREEWLRQPRPEETAALELQNRRRGFPGMIGSIDCMLCYWDMCPAAWAGAYTGRAKRPTLVLEAVASESRRVWHYYFGLPGACNDLNAFDASPVGDLFTTPTGAFRKPFTVSGQRFNSLYMLGDGIYPSIPFIATPLEAPATEEERHYVDRQASVRKDVECTFGIARKQWKTLKNPSRYHHPHTIHLVVVTCLILHNMNCEDRYSSALVTGPDAPRCADIETGVRRRFYRPPPDTPPRQAPPHHVTDRAEHDRLKVALLQHLWQQHGSGRA